MQVVIDRFEGRFAVVELPDGLCVNIPKVLVPEACEGDVINILIDKAASEERKVKTRALMEAVWHKN